MITDHSLRSLGKFLKGFNAISHLNMAYSIKINSLESEYFYDCLAENYSLTELDISYIKISGKAYDQI